MIPFFQRPALAYALAGESPARRPGQGGKVPSLLLSVYDEIKSFGDRDRFYKRAADKELDDILKEADRPADQADFDRYYSARDLAPETPQVEEAEPAVPAPAGQAENLEAVAADSPCGCGCGCPTGGETGETGSDCLDENGYCHGYWDASGVCHCGDETGGTGGETGETGGETGGTGTETGGCLDENGYCHGYWDASGVCHCGDETGGTGGETGETGGSCDECCDCSQYCDCSSFCRCGGQAGAVGSGHGCGCGGGCSGCQPSGCSGCDCEQHCLCSEYCNCEELCCGDDATGCDTGSTGGETGCGCVCTCTCGCGTGGTGGNTGGTGCGCGGDTGCTSCCPHCDEGCGNETGCGCDAGGEPGNAYNGCGRSEGGGCVGAGGYSGETAVETSSAIGCPCDGEGGEDGPYVCGACCDCSYICYPRIYCDERDCSYNLNGRCGKHLPCEDNIFEDNSFRPHCGCAKTEEDRPVAQPPIPQARPDNPRPLDPATELFYRNERKRIMGE